MSCDGFDNTGWLGADGTGQQAARFLQPAGGLPPPAAITANWLQHYRAVPEMLTVPLNQQFSSEGTFPILAGDITPYAVMEKIKTFSLSNSVALEEI